MRKLERAALIDAARAGAIAAVLALPLLGFRLVDSAQGLSLGYRLSWVVYAAVAAFVLRLAWSYGRSALHLGYGPPPDPASRLSPLRRIDLPTLGEVEERAGQTSGASQSQPMTYLPQRGEVDGATPASSRRSGIGWGAIRVSTGGIPEPLAFATMIAVAFALPFVPFVDRNLLDTATLILIYVMLATGLSITVGLAGLLDLGYVAFYAVGAYSYALLAQAFGISFWAALPIAGLLAAGFGLLLGFPVLRLRGDYLAIVTLGFGQIVRVILTNWTEVTGGPNGISGVPRPTFLGLPFAATSEAGPTFAQYFGVPFAPEQRIIFLYYLILVLALIAMLFVRRVRKLALGRAWEALREDETAAVSLGLNPTTIKLSAFALGASIAGIAGAFFAARQGFVSPESFTFVETAIILSIVVLGGMGSPVGIVIAAIFLVGLPEWFRGLAEYRMLAFGAAMVLIMVFRPRGFSERAPTLYLSGKSS
jgi:branched-chain amino acid transport system permease protein